MPVKPRFWRTLWQQNDRGEWSTPETWYALTPPARGVPTQCIELLDFPCQGGMEESGNLSRSAKDVALSSRSSRTPFSSVCNFSLYSR